MTTPALHVMRRSASLWRLAIPPAVWFLHFLLTYVTVAISCGKGLQVSRLIGVRGALIAYTLGALIAIGVSWAQAIRAQRDGSASTEHAGDAPLEARRFLGFTTVLLSIMSAIAVAYSAASVVVLTDCR